MHTVWALIFGVVLSIIAFSSVNGFIKEILSDTNTRFLVYVIIILLWVLYWAHYKFCLPKNKKHMVGLVVAIHTESSHEENRLRADLISNLQKSILNEGLGNLINIIVLKNHFCEKIKDARDVYNMRKKVKGHFYLFGKAKRRKDGENKYFLDLDGLVVHTPVDMHTSSALSQDFISVLPKEISFFESMEFKGFRITADIIYLAVKYITGIASYLSGDPNLAIKLHTNLKDEFDKLKPLPPNIQKIKNKVPSLLSDEELFIARSYYIKEDFPNMEKQVSKALEINPNSYGAWLVKAIVDFRFKNDPVEALKSIKMAKRYVKNTGEWRYSQAFLQLWLEKYPDAIRTIDKIIKCSYFHEPITATEVEQFNLKLLKEGKFKPQLYFWLGFINYKKTNNLPKSLEYLEEFEKKCTDEMLPLKNKSTPYLREIKKMMQLT